MSTVSLKILVENSGLSASGLNSIASGKKYKLKVENSSSLYYFVPFTF
jgi:hypothetical protein